MDFLYSKLCYLSPGELASLKGQYTPKTKNASSEFTDSLYLISYEIELNDTVPLTKNRL